MARKRSSSDINIPLDLMVEILDKLPAKSLARFQCVSYEWKSMINNFIVIDSIVTRSLTKPPRDPHFIFHVVSWVSKPLALYNYPHQIINEEKRLYHGEIFGGGGEGKYAPRMSQYVRGLIGIWYARYLPFKIHNPTTRQSFLLPKTLCAFYYFGYDPLSKQYKVMGLPLCMNETCEVFTLGDPAKKWRKIPCSIGPHVYLFHQVVCINGAIYYIARKEKWSSVLVRFDVGSEKFNQLQIPEKLLPDCDGSLINYQGKLGCICREKYPDENEVNLWVMECVEKQEWSKITFVSMLRDLPSGRKIEFAGATHPGTGEIIIFYRRYRNEFAIDVHYYDPKQNSCRRVEIQTTTPINRSDVYSIAVPDNVENIMVL